jgi:hypothetical protein
MRRLLFTMVISVTALALGEAEARDVVAPEVEILSVVARSPDVMPYVMSLPAEGKPRLAISRDKNVPAAPNTDSQDRKPEQRTIAQRR